MSSMIIIGAGPAGYETALYAASKGMQVDLVEKGPIGGTCLNTGCIPTKAFLHKVQDSRIDCSDYEQTIQSIDESIAGMSASILRVLKTAGVRIHEGEGFITGGRQLSVQVMNELKAELHANAVVLASGSKARELPVRPASGAAMADSGSVWRLSRWPESVAVIGGGAIGMEFATVFSTMGIPVAVIEAAGTILPSMDADLVKRYAVYAKRQGILLHPDATVQAIGEEGGKTFVSYSDHAGSHRLVVDLVLNASGRTGCFDRERLSMLGILHNNSYVTTDDSFRTSLPGVYAIGDVNGKSLLAHSAVDQGRQLVDHLLYGQAVVQKTVPVCIFTHPEMASAGLNEDGLRRNGIDYVSAKVQYGSNGKAAVSGMQDGFIKMYGDKKGNILGLHILGAHASDLVHYGVMAMEGGIGAGKIAEMVFAHPTLGELFVQCARALADKIGEKYD